MNKSLFYGIAVFGLAGAAGLVLTSQTVEAEYYENPPNYTQLPSASFSSDMAPLSAKARSEMIKIDAGDFTIGRDDGPDDERPAHKVKLPAFKMDRHEVTNAAFAEYLNALNIQVPSDLVAGTHDLSETLPKKIAALITEGDRGQGLYPLIALDDDQARIDFAEGQFSARAGYGDHPVAETTWAGAYAYCVWREGHLPSEVEWEAAARGSDGRLYPWGNSAPKPDQVFISNRSGVTGPVGQHPTGGSAFGVLDMSASLAEWTSSIKRAYPYDADDGREDASLAGERVTRGGDYIYDTNARTLSATFRDGFSNAPHRGHRHIGFRCAAKAD